MPPAPGEFVFRAGTAIVLVALLVRVVTGVAFPELTRAAGVLLGLAACLHGLLLALDVTSAARAGAEHARRQGQRDPLRAPPYTWRPWYARVSGVCAVLVGAVSAYSAAVA